MPWAFLCLPVEIDHPKAREALRAVQKKGQGYRSDIVRNSNEVVASKTSGSDSTSYTIDRLHREAPELYEHVHPAHALMTIDENLMRSELTATEYAEHMQRRKEIWEAMRAESKPTQSAQVFEGRGNKGFSSETETATGATQSTVNRATRRAREVCQQARDVTRGTKADVYR